MQDGALVGHGDEVPLVLRGALAEVLQVAGHVHGADEAARVGQIVDEVDTDPGHPVDVQHYQRLSVSCTPAAYFSSGDPGADIRYGITYMVLPADAPVISPVSLAFISPAGYQLL